MIDTPPPDDYSGDTWSLCRDYRDFLKGLKGIFGTTVSSEVIVLLINSLSRTGEGSTGIDGNDAGVQSLLPQTYKGGYWTG